VDEDLRALERADGAGGVEARARALAARRRAGRLDEARLAAAAALGDPAARAVVGGVVGGAMDGAGPPDPIAWLEGLPEGTEGTVWDEAWLRAALAGAEHALAAAPPSDAAPGPRRCLEVADAFVACPCEAHAAAAGALALAQGRLNDHLRRRAREGHGARTLAAADAAYWIAHAASAPVRAASLARFSLEKALTVGPADRVREAVRDALVRWLLA
jgi:hypothetical protein